MAMTYSSLVAAKTTAGSIKNWVNYDQIDSDGVLTDAQNWIYSRLRLREMRASAPLTVADQAAFVALPTDFLDPIRLRDVTNDYEIEIVDEGSLTQWKDWDTTVIPSVLQEGTVSYAAIYDERFNFECLSDGGFTGELLYYKKPTLLTLTTNESNFLCTRHSNLLRSACMAFAYDQYHDDANYVRSMSRAEEFAQTIAVQDDLSRRGQNTYPDVW